MLKQITLYIIMVLLLSGCGNESTQLVVKEKKVTIGTLKGPTGIGLVKLFNNESYDIQIMTQPDQLIPRVINKEVDIATVPANLAAVLYHKSKGQVKVVGVNAVGVLYIVSKNPQIQSLQDLQGKTVIATGRGATPEYVINKVIEKNGLKVDVNYLPNHAELAAQVAAGTVETALLPEPFVSIAMTANPELKVVVDLNAEWQKLFNSDIPVGVTIAQSEFIKNNPAALVEFLKDYRESVNLIANDVATAATETVTNGIMAKQSVAQIAIPRCGIVCVTGDAAGKILKPYYEAYFKSQGKMPAPDQNFYYE